MDSIFRWRTGFVAGFALVVAGVLAPSALANSPLTVSKTATAHWTGKYEWTIDKSVSKSTIELKKGQSATATYTVTVTRSLGTDSMWVDGEICVSNGGAVATENLVVVDRLRAFLPGGSVTLISSTIDTSANPVLDPGESYCYPYSFPFGPYPNATTYENDARITITNDPREPGTPLGPSATAPFSVPDAPAVTNDAVHVDDTNGMSWLFSDSGSQSYNRTFTCDRDKGTHTNTATIRETGQSDSATVVVKCTDKPDCPTGHDDDYKGKGKHKGDGHHGHHSGYGDRGRSYSYRGRDGQGGDDHNRCGDDDDSSDDSSDNSTDDSDDSSDDDDKDHGDRGRGWDH